MANRAGNRDQFEYYTHIVKSGDGTQDAGRSYFAADGTLSTTASDSVGPMTFLEIRHTRTGQLNVRVYGPHGTTAPDTEAAYTLLLLQGGNSQTAVPESGMNVWKAPEGMLINSIMVVTNPGAGVIVDIRAGR